MEDKIFDILTDLIRDDITKDEAIDKLLILYNVGARLESSLGGCSKGNEYEIVPYEGVFWINHKVVGSGEPLSQWVQSVLNGD